MKVRSCHSCHTLVQRIQCLRSYSVPKLKYSPFKALRDPPSSIPRAPTSRRVSRRAFLLSTPRGFVLTALFLLPRTLPHHPPGSDHHLPVRSSLQTLFKISTLPAVPTLPVSLTDHHLRTARPSPDHGPSTVLLPLD